ncbi:hypothetical protein KIW84_015177 [Lathyrus oleraceus]|uniref:Uncharacterized protein n=1 Tax=Pisum sativum TaxID=3888 RepID=A0A9D5H0D5_PEA|nr:hypothetical protein KIW84_015177 [Pisum sativum]
MGRIQKLEHVRVPSVPHSETVATASSMLEQSIRKQKLQGVSLTKAIFVSVWKSLALNAVLAAVATLCWASPTLVSAFTFGACILVETELTAATVLSALATFRIFARTNLQSAPNLFP